MKNQYYNDEMELKEIFIILWKKKLLIFCITVLSAIISISYSLSIPNVYKSSALLAPAQSSSSKSALGNYSSLANIAGIQIPTESGDNTIEAMEIMRSFQFFSNNIFNSIELEDLFAAKSWSENNKIIYNEKIYDIDKGNWTREVSPPKTNIPSSQEAYKEFKKIFNISQNKNTSFITVSIEHISPFVAKEWLELIINQINESMRDFDRENASKSIDFLNKKFKLTNNNEIKNILANLLQEQTEILMLVEANKDYVFRTIDAPIAQEEKFKPQRLLVTIIGTLIGAILAVIFSVYLHFYRNN